MKDTAELRGKMMAIWREVDAGKISHTEARVHIGFARTVLDSLKVDIAAAHLNQGAIPSAPISTAPVLTIARNGKKKAA